MRTTSTAFRRALSRFARPSATRSMPPLGNTLLRSMALKLHMSGLAHAYPARTLLIIHWAATPELVGEVQTDTTW